MKEMKDYIDMQQKFYDTEATKWSVDNTEPVVGTFGQHNDCIWYEELFRGIENTNELIALDFACGPGRNIVKYWNLFKRIDGVDISKINLQKANDWVTHNNLDGNYINLYKCNGFDLEDVKNEEYDIVFSTIALQHICVYKIRYNYFKEFYRVLKNNGIISIQMGFGDGHHCSSEYYENNYDANGTNGTVDVKIKDPEDLKKDLYEIGFKDFTYCLTPRGPGDSHNEWIFFRAIK